MEVVQLSTDSFNLLCRTCLAAADTTVFQIVFEDIQLVEMFEKCTTIQMNEDDQLPHNICKNCIDEMLRFYKFRTKCLETQAVLTKMIADEEDRKLNTVLEIKQPEIDIWDVYNGLESGIEQSADVESVNQSTSNQVWTNAQQLYARANRLTELVCYVCNIRFESRLALLKHRAQRGHPKGVRTCVPCPRCSESCLITCLKSHVLKKHPHLEIPYKCDVCFKHFDLPGQLEEHRAVHMNKQKFMCDLCGMAFRSQLTKAFHVLAHKIVDVESHACRDCEQQFTGQDELKRHELGECPNRLPVVAASLQKTAQLGCSDCVAVFSSQSDLNEHIKSHKMNVENHLDLDRGRDNNISKKDDIKLNTGLEIIEQDEKEIFDVDNRLESGIEQSSDVESVNESTSNRVVTNDQQSSTRANASTDSICSVSNIGFESHPALALASGEADDPKGDSMISSKSATTTSMKKHMRTQTQQRAYKCNVCEKSYSCSGNLKQHKLIHSDPRRFSCDVCGKGFTRKEQKNKHMLMHTRKKFHTCRACKQQFNDRRDLTKHKLRNCPKRLAVVGSNSKRATTCYVCNKKFDYYDELVAHRNEPGHPKNKAIVPCPICSQLTRVKRMKLHLLKHSAEKLYVCNVCGKAFKNSGNLSRHTKIHTVDGEKPFQCDLCGKGFTQAQSKKAHMLLHAKGYEPNAHKCFSRCKECGKLFRNPRYYAEHVSRKCTSEKELPEDKPKRRYGLLAEHEKQFLCQYCGKRLSSKPSYDIHVRVHEGIKPFLCTMCGRRFTQYSLLHTHELSHTREKPYSCKICKKSFTQNSHVRYHMKLIHSTERPFVCIHCGKAFAIKCNLSAHMRTHTGETPYICNYCGKRFCHSNNMNKHRRSQHGHKNCVEKYRICDKTEQ